MPQQLVIWSLYTIFLIGSIQVVCSETSQLVSCDKSEFIKKFVNTGSSLNDVTKEFLQNKCSKNLECALADFELIYAYAEKHQKFYYYVLIKNLIASQRKDCWGFVLTYQTSPIGKPNTTFIGFGDAKDEYMTFIPVIGRENYKISLETYPIAKSINIDIKAPGPCENEVLDEISQRISIIGKPSCSYTPSLKQRSALAEGICLIYPESQPLRRYAVTKSIIKDNCTINFQPDSLPFLKPKKSKEEEEEDDEELASNHPLILVIPLATTSLCLLVILILVTTKICIDRKLIFSSRKRRNSMALFSRQVSPDGDRNGSVQTSAEVLVTESSFRAYDTV